jgi:hypothetical protein
MKELWLGGVAAAVLAITACGKGDSPTGPGGAPATPVGAYTLLTIDAKELPFTMYSDTGYTLEIQSGSLSVTSTAGTTTGGKWVAKVIQRETVAGFVSTYNDSTFGTWTLPAGATTAVFTNAESNTASSVTWTSADATVTDVDGTTTHRSVYKRN